MCTKKNDKDILLYKDRQPQPEYYLSDKVSFSKPKQYPQLYAYSLNKEMEAQTDDYERWGSTLWKAIHVIGSTFDIERKLDEVKIKKDECSSMMVDSFRNFFISLSVLLPKEEARELVTAFLKNHSPDPYLHTNEALYWTYNLHSFVNESVKINYKSPSYDDIRFTYARVNIDKKTWGNLFWFVIHFLASSMPDNIGKNQKLAFTSLMFSFQCLIPCPMCRQHLYAHLKDFKLDKYLVSRDSIFEWTVILHNRVNKSLNKKEYSLSQARKDYFL